MTAATVVDTYWKTMELDRLERLESISLFKNSLDFRNDANPVYSLSNMELLPADHGPGELYETVLSKRMAPSRPTTWPSPRLRS